MQFLSDRQQFFTDRPPHDMCAGLSFTLFHHDSVWKKSLFYVLLRCPMKKQSNHTARQNLNDVERPVPSFPYSSPVTGLDWKFKIDLKLASAYALVGTDAAVGTIRTETHSGRRFARISWYVGALLRGSISYQCKIALTRFCSARSRSTLVICRVLSVSTTADG